MAINKRKVAIIGAGHVGSHGGYALISQGLVEELVYIDVNHEKAVAQALDLQDSSTYLGRRVKVYAGNYSNIQDADILLVAAGRFLIWLQVRQTDSKLWVQLLQF